MQIIPHLSVTVTYYTVYGIHMLNIRRKKNEYINISMKIIYVRMNLQRSVNVWLEETIHYLITVLYVKGR